MYRFRPHYSGGAAFVNRQLFDRLGLYDDRMFVGFEDFELGIRAILLGNPVKGRLIHDIKLIHNHIYAKRTEDKTAVLARYNISSLESSFNRMTEKHKVTLEGDWQKWVHCQVEKIHKNQDITRIKYAQKCVTNWIISVLRRSYRLALAGASAILPNRVKRIVKKASHIQAQF